MLQLLDLETIEFIPVYQPSLDGTEIKNVLEALQSGWISSKGEFIQQFENRFSKFIGVDHASAVTNGTVAIHLALLALNIQPGDEVIVPTFTYVASINPVVQMNAVPVFVDCENQFWQIDPEAIRRKITSKTKAIIITHLYGHPCDMDAIMQIAKEYNLSVVEDAAEAFGTYYKGKHVGTFGDIATFSFYGNKTITTGEGGMVVSNRFDLIERVNLYKNQANDPHKKYWHADIGYNYRMTNITAAIGCAQLNKSQWILARKQAIALQYENLFKNTSIQIQPVAAYAIPSFWMVSILLPHAKYRNDLIDYLQQQNIETRPLFYPTHTMPMFARFLKETDSFSNTESIHSRGLNLPSWPGMSDQQIQRVTQSIHDFMITAKWLKNGK